MDLAEARDLTIVVWGIIFSITLLVILVATIVLTVAVKKLIGVVNVTIETDVKDTLTKVGETAEQVKGATEFMTDTTVAPVIRVYSTVSAAKQFVKTMAGKGRKKRRFPIPFKS